MDRGGPAPSGCGLGRPKGAAWRITIIHSHDKSDIISIEPERNGIGLVAQEVE